MSQPTISNMTHLASALKTSTLDLETYRPELFRLDHFEDRERLMDLFNQQNDITVLDEFEPQLRSLMETRNPERTLDADELSHFVQQHLGGKTPNEYGVWVYYPWSHRLLHILDEDEFVELRTSRNHYKITNHEQATLSQKIAGVVGLSVGQSVALTMAIERSCGEIRLADFDKLELTNLNRLRSGLHELGLPKVIIAAREIAEIDPFLRVRCFTDGITERNLDTFLLEGGKLSLLIEECDGLDMKFLCRKRAREYGIPVVMDTSDRGMLDVERFDLEPDRPLFHGFVEEPSTSELQGLSSDEKVPYVLDILGCETMSSRMRASMLEVGNSIPTWPQLASSVALGGAVTGDVSRRILLGSFRDSGRYFVDVEKLIADRVEEVAPSDGRNQVGPNETSTFKTLDESDMQRLAQKASQFLPTTTIELDDQRLQQLVTSATLAPSGGNTQPWRWLYFDQRLWLFHADYSQPSLLDFEHRGSHIGLGAATENLVLESHRLGIEVTVRKLPLSSHPQLVAGFSFHVAESGTETAARFEPHVQNELVKQIPLRLTNRTLGARSPIEIHRLQPLIGAARSFDDADFQIVQSDADLDELGRIIGAADRLRLLHRQGHQDFVNEVRWTQTDVKQTRDGIDLATIDLTQKEIAGLQMIRDWSVVERLKNWDVGKGFETLSRKSIDAASAVGLIRIRNSGSDTFFDGGRVLQRVWLEATRQRLALHPVSGLLFLFGRLAALESGQITDGISFSPEMQAELTQLRDRFSTVFGVRDKFQNVFLVRLSLAENPQVRSLRKPVEDVLAICR